MELRRRTRRTTTTVQCMNDVEPRRAIFYGMPYDDSEDIPCNDVTGSFASLDKSAAGDLDRQLKGLASKRTKTNDMKLSGRSAGEKTMTRSQNIEQIK